MPWNVTASQEELAFLMEAGLIYRDSRRFAEAETVFQGVRALAPRSEVPEVALGTLAVEQGDLDRAVGHYQAALKMTEKSAFAQAHLGEAHLFRKEPELARRHLARAVELDPRHEAGRFAKGLLSLLDAQPK